MNERIRRNTPALVEQTLANYGAWDAVAFLLISHRLPQAGYEAWRMGDAECLEDMMKGNLQRMLEMLEAASLHATSMGLISEPATWSGWGKQAGQNLRLFHDDDTNTRFQIRLKPKADRPQLDLFMDAPHIILLNRLRQALLNRSPECDALFDRALDDIANEPALARLDSIRSAMRMTAIEQPEAWLGYLNDVIAPAVVDEFAHRSLDIMAPLWRSSADAMAQFPFNPEQADNHASYALLLAHAWEQCLTSVEQVPDWFKYASLHDRRIAALGAMHDHQAEREAWMMYCWYCPDAASTALDCAALNDNGLHACGLHALWQQFSQMENEQAVEDFPALMALRFRFDVEQDSLLEHAKHTTGGRHYQQVIALLRSEQSGNVDIALRSILKTSSPWLLQVFMADRG